MLVIILSFYSVSIKTHEQVQPRWQKYTSTTQSLKRFSETRKSFNLKSSKQPHNSSQQHPPRTAVDCHHPSTPPQFHCFPSVGKYSIAPRKNRFLNAHPPPQVHFKVTARRRARKSSPKNPKAREKKIANRLANFPSYLPCAIRTAGILILILAKLLFFTPPARFSVFVYVCVCARRTAKARPFFSYFSLTKCNERTKKKSLVWGLHQQ